MVGLSMGVGMGGRSLIEETELFLEEEVLDAREARLDSNTAPAVDKHQIIIHVAKYNHEQMGSWYNAVHFSSKCTIMTKD